MHDDKPPDDRMLISEREAARRLSLTTRTLFSLRMAGELPYVRIGSRVLYAPADLAVFIACAGKMLESTNDCDHGRS